MIYRPIRTLQDFQTHIRFGVTPESLHLDFKKTFTPGKSEDVAIDLAAFANTQGGVLLFGVSESASRNRIRVASGVAPNLDVEALKQFLNNAALDKIRPTVRFESTMIQLDDGPVLAVNVEPSIELVGVCLHRDRLAFSFPYRTEHGNRYMDLAQVEERMSASNSRRSYLKLLSLLGKPGIHKQAILYPHPSGSAPSDTWYVELLSDSDQVFVLRKNSREAHMPLSLIEEAWRMDNMETGRIAIRLSHRLFSPDGHPIDFDDSQSAVLLRAMQQRRKQMLEGPSGR
jgi:hypothetical protein